MMQKERIIQDYKQALKAGDSTRVSVIRLLRAAIKNAEIEKGRELTDAEVCSVINSQIRQRRESIEAFEKANRADLVQKERGELAILQSYLPEQLCEEEIRDLAAQAIQEVSALSPRDMGRVMSVLMPKVKGRADGKLVNETVRKLLEGAGGMEGKEGE